MKQAHDSACLGSRNQIYEVGHLMGVCMCVCMTLMGVSMYVHDPDGCEHAGTEVPCSLSCPPLQRWSEGHLALVSRYESPWSCIPACTVSIPKLRTPC